MIENICTPTMGVLSGRRHGRYRAGRSPLGEELEIGVRERLDFGIVQFLHCSDTVYGGGAGTYPRGIVGALITVCLQAIC